MTSAAIALLFFASQFRWVIEGFDDISPQVAAERVARCGIGTPIIKNADEIQSYVLTLPDLTLATDEQLACADKAVSHHDLQLPATLQSRFMAIREKRFAALAMAEAKEWLAEKGLLERVPTYIKGTTDDLAFTRAVEKLCGPRAKGAFGLAQGLHTFSPAWNKRQLRPSAADSNAFTCVTHVLTVTNFGIGIIGSEAASGPARGRR